MDVGKYKYEIQKKINFKEKNQHVSLVKEIRLRPNTDVHDFNFKVRHAIQFIEEGHKVKVSVFFKGRQIVYKEQGEEILQKFINDLKEVSKVEQEIKLEGKNMHLMLAPDKSKQKQNKVSENKVKE